MKKAVALSYDEDKDKAPIIKAKGEGYIAEEILAVGEEEGVATYRNDELVEALLDEEIGDHIPVELYDVVAEILTFINELDDEIN